MARDLRPVRLAIRTPPKEGRKVRLQLVRRNRDSSILYAVQDAKTKEKEKEKEMEADMGGICHGGDKNECEKTKSNPPPHILSSSQTSSTTPPHSARAFSRSPMPYASQTSKDPFEDQPFARFVVLRGAAAVAATWRRQASSLAEILSQTMVENGPDLQEEATFLSRSLDVLVMRAVDWTSRAAAVAAAALETHEAWADDWKDLVLDSGNSKKNVRNDSENKNGVNNSDINVLSSNSTTTTNNNNNNNNNSHLRNIANTSAANNNVSKQHGRNVALVTPLNVRKRVEEDIRRTFCTALLVRESKERLRHEALKNSAIRPISTGAPSSSSSSSSTSSPSFLLSNSSGGHNNNRSNAFNYDSATINDILDYLICNDARRGSGGEGGANSTSSTSSSTRHHHHHHHHHPHNNHHNSNQIQSDDHISSSFLNASSSANSNTMDPNPSPFVYGYQMYDGQCGFLHPLSLRCIAAHYGHCFDVVPHVLEAAVLEVETLVQDEVTRKRHKQTAHVPLTAEFKLIEIDISPFVSAEARTPFLTEIRHREARRKRAISQAAVEARHDAEREQKARENRIRHYQSLSNPFPFFSPEHLNAMPTPAETIREEMSGGESGGSGEMNVDRRRGGNRKGKTE
eukprot:CAMPEP_0175054240 /NCGR_PEP_ID=MMETSP0052_2-20121109/9394_1 /TAXON_ID=51329 ORGANISM="Polytomella parva, Strain SAG 63-3" /NCGR_SAMPLE_ID=MMETSP0052_2 /ASSEMBLY_ACC=CAM_ASM_000194 /LENGTH=627 /DNA_ID=CAMNT_0016318911 /DNA_START=505 /DNA_END=2385 /DNA_ORIENTATION=-